MKDYIHSIIVSAVGFASPFFVLYMWTGSLAPSLETGWAAVFAVLLAGIGFLIPRTL